MNGNSYKFLKKKLLDIKGLLGTLDISYHLEEQRYANNSFSNDFTLQIIMQNETYCFNVNVKKQLAGNSALKLIEDKYNNYSDYNQLLVANYISPKIEEYLLDKKISFINASGKVFLHQNQLILYFDYPQKSHNSIISGAAFETTGVKFIYHLLNKPESINESYQRLSEITGISVGSITNIIKDLKKNGFVYTLNNKRILRNRDELLDQWFVAYGRKLRPKILIGRYRRIEQSKNLVLPNGCYWSGEVAAEILNLNLRSQDQTIYTNSDSLQVVKELRLVPDQNGPLEILNTFWNKNIQYEQLDNVVQKPLIYADLMLSGNDRNIEIAHELFK